MVFFRTDNALKWTLKSTVKLNGVNWNLKGQCLIFIGLVVQSIITAPQSCLHYSLWTSEHVNLWVKRDFTDVMKNFVMGNCTGWFRWIQCVDEDSYKREGRVRKRTCEITKGVQARLKRFENASLEGGEQCPEPKNAFSDVGGGKQMESPLETTGGAQTWPHLVHPSPTFDLCNCKISHLCCVKPISLR